MVLDGLFGRRPPADLGRERARMVARDLVPRGIRDPRVVQAMAQVPRERFVPPELVLEAYADRALPIGYGQTISQPYMVAVMIERLELEGGETVLEIGTGSGYATAILARICNWVVGIERIPALARAATRRLTELGYMNVDLMVGDGAEGFADGAPYEGILVSAAAPVPPPALLDQLAAGGRLVIPIGAESGVQELMVFRRKRGEAVAEPGFACRFVPLRHGTVSPADPDDDDEGGPEGGRDPGGRDLRPGPEPPGPG
jgi:protein-L-isoaspartate(D-aspartate) O-methyltransferase